MAIFWFGVCLIKRRKKSLNVFLNVSLLDGLFLILLSQKPEVKSIIF